MATEDTPVNTEENQPEPTFEPVHRLTDADRVETNTGEENETDLFKMRAKLFRFEKATSEWKERGTGDLKLLRHKESNKIRLVMRRDKTHKVCANHYITSEMKLAPNVGSDRSWVWNVLADVSDGEPSAETLAVRFANSENANLFKQKFEDAQASNTKLASGGDAANKAPETTSDATETTSSASQSQPVEKQPEAIQSASSSQQAPPNYGDPAQPSSSTAHGGEESASTTTGASNQSESVAESKAREAAEDAERAKAEEDEAPPSY